MKIYLATGNPHKKSEMAQICSGHTIAIPSDEGIDFDPIEDGLTFCENSLIKAKTLFEAVKAPVLADDSGICVDVINGAPGIYSARYGGKTNIKGSNTEKKLNQAEKNILLIEHVNEEIQRKYGSSLKSMSEKERQALRSCRYVCSMTLYLGKQRFYCIQETFEGILLEDISKASGQGGFGYDPIVFLPKRGLTVAQLTAEEKNAISHRGKATKEMLKLL